MQSLLALLKGVGLCRQGSRNLADTAALASKTMIELQPLPRDHATRVRLQQPDTSATAMAKPAGCPVVVGKICWFCCKPAEVIKKRRNPLLNTKSMMCIPAEDINNVDIRNQDIDGGTGNADQFDNAYGCGEWQNFC